MKITENILFLDLEPLTGLNRWTVLQVTVETRKFGVNHPEQQSILDRIGRAVKDCAGSDREVHQELEDHGRFTLKELLYHKDRAELTHHLNEQGISQLHCLVTGTEGFPMKFAFVTKGPKCCHERST